MAGFLPTPTSAAGFRIGKNSEKPGKYELISRVSSSITDPGGSLRIDILITGYGMIQGGKIHFSFPRNLTASTGRKSTITHSLMPTVSGNTHDITWGSTTSLLGPSELILGLGGVHTQNDPEETMFFDYPVMGISKSGATPTISTEMAMGIGKDEDLSPPFKIDLKIDKKTKPGTYTIQAVFTYFNGEVWQNSILNIPIVVRNRFQRNENWISALGIVAAIASISGIVSLVLQIITMCK